MDISRQSQWPPVTGNQGWSTKNNGTGLTADGQPDMRLAVNRLSEWREQFLTSYRQTGILKSAFKAAGIDRRTFYICLERVPEFAQQVADAKEDAIETLEEMAQQRAMANSDMLMIFILKALRPDVYRENQFRIGVSGEVEGSVKMEARINVLRGLILNPELNDAVHGLLGLAIGHPGGAGDTAIEGTVAARPSPADAQPGADGRGSDEVSPANHRDASPSR